MGDAGSSRLTRRRSIGCSLTRSKLRRSPLTLQTLAEPVGVPAFSTLARRTSRSSSARSLGDGAPGGCVGGTGIGHAFYALRSGQVNVVRDGTLLGTQGAGSHFGEIALLRDVPRTASVVARTPVRAFRIDREGFDLAVREAFRRGSLKLPADRTWQH